MWFRNLPEKGALERHQKLVDTLPLRAYRKGVGERGVTTAGITPMPFRGIKAEPALEAA
jgi:hypothetical protein